MMATKIEWTDETWNPVTGCTPISTGCRNCYAARMAVRLAGRYGYAAEDPFRVTLHPERLGQPRGWKKPKRIFVCSMGDLFHCEIPRAFRERVMAEIVLCRRHQFLVLTKRNVAMAQWAREEEDRCFDRLDRIFPNLWLGVTAENASEAQRRIPDVVCSHAAVRFVSCEPLLGPGVERHLAGVDWVIVGCESGPGRRPMELEWAINIVLHCQEKGIPVFVKQVPLDGRVSHDPNEWPEALRVREYPE